MAAGREAVVARVFAAMSGGVDSSVAAALLVEAGHDVVGVTMRLLGEDAPGGCCPSGSVRDARRVCDLLGIPHYTWDLREAFEQEVVSEFLDEYAAGRTPNPCVTCNDRVKSGVLLERVCVAGGEYLATGHYARVVATDDWNRVARGADPAKDQSYFLYRSTSDQLAHMLFPVGEMTKGEVRERARELDLPTAESPESQEACFVSGRDVRSFVKERRPEAFVPGEIVDASGRVVGRHDGAAGHTVGQRHGLGVSTGEPAYVTAIEPGPARLVVGPRAALASRRVVAHRAVWHGAPGPMRVTARVRSRGSEAPASVRVDGDTLVVEFDEAVEAAAPGQAVVCWDGDIVIGGGMIGGSV